jgi:peptidoglycan/LPS O-acetylase OafA/YrhL
MLSHLGIRVNGLNIGVIAVVMFYILAGYVVSYIYSLYQNYTLFIRDRIKRIFPLYLFMLGLTTLFLLITDFANPHFTLFNIFTNLTILPLNYYMLIDNAILSTPHWWLIPPAWSLGTELQAYILLPFILLYPKIKYISISISFIIYLLSAFALIQPDYFGYRLIVGVLFIFILGVSIRDKRGIDKAFLLLVWVVTLILLYFHIDNKAYIKETSISMLIGIPLIYTLSITKIKLPLNSFFGSLSYAIFLSHFLAIWIVDYLTIIEYKLIYIVSISLLISLFGVFIEKKLKKRM